MEVSVYSMVNPNARGNFANALALSRNFDFCQFCAAYYDNFVTNGCSHSVAKSLLPLDLAAITSPD